MTATEDLTTPPSALIAAVTRAGQAQVFRCWDRLDSAGRAGLIRQLETVDWDGLPALQSLVGEHRRGIVAAGIGDLATAETPPCVRLGTDEARADAERLGERALAAGRIGAVLVAGGQGSRLGCNGPKGLYRVGPVSDASLFELLLGRLVAVRQRYGRDVPLAIMTSAATDAGTREFLAKHGHCGLTASSTWPPSRSTIHWLYRWMPSFSAIICAARPTSPLRSSASGNQESGWEW
jgi:UDP-N-acetylglucosamine/UDP-N-acetylgalactosamine diphosphorylase